MHGSDALKALEIPQLDSHVCRAGCKQFSSLVKRDILYRVCVALQCAFKISCLIIPHLEDDRFTHLLNRLSLLIYFGEKSKDLNVVNFKQNNFLILSC